MTFRLNDRPIEGPLFKLVPPERTRRRMVALWRDVKAASGEYHDRLMEGYGRYALALKEAAEGHERVAADQMRAAIAVYEGVGYLVGMAHARMELALLGTVSVDEAPEDELVLACRHYEELDDKEGRANARLELGRVRKERGTLDAAERDLHEAHDLYKTLGDVEGQADALLELGRVEAERSALHEAAVSFLSARGLYESLDLYAGVLAFLAAFGLYESLDKSLAGKWGQAHAHLGLGRVAKQAGALDAAEGELRAACDMYKSLGSDLGRANARLELGEVALRAGKRDAAKGEFEAAAALYRSIDDQQGLGNAYMSLGELAVEEDLNTARQKFETALAAFEQVGEEQSIGNCHLMLGDVAFRAGQDGVAAEEFGIALGCYEEIEHGPGIANACYGLGLCATGRRDWAEAAGHFGRAADLYEALEDYEWQAHALDRLGQVARAEQRWRDALEFDLQARLARARAGAALGRAPVLVQLARAAVARGDRTEAERILRAAFDSLESERSLLDSLAERSAYVGRMAPVYEDMLGLAGDLDRPVLAAEIMESLRRDAVGLLAQAAGATLPASVSEALDDLADATRRALAAEAAANEDETESPQPEIREAAMAAAVAARRRVEELTEAVRDGLSRRSVFTRLSLPPKFDIDIVAGRANSRGAALLMVGELGERVVRVWSTPGSAPSLSVVPLSVAAAALLGSLTDPDVDVPRELSASPGAVRAGFVAMREALIPDPLTAGIEAGVVSALVLAPAGRLWTVPWAGLPVGDCYLATRAVTHALPSLSMLQYVDFRARTAVSRPGPLHRLVRRLRVTPRAGLYVDTSFEGHLPLLSAARRRGGTLLATAEQVDQFVSDERNAEGVTVFVAHDNDEGGIHQAVVLAGGEDQYPAVRLLTRGCTQTVVMACCRLGHLVFPTGDEALGFATLAIAAGADRVIAALFRISERTVSRIAADILKALRAGSAAGPALQAAQRPFAVADRPLYEWATMLAIGIPPAE